MGIRQNVLDSLLRTLFQTTHRRAKREILHVNDLFELCVNVWANLKQHINRRRIIFVRLLLQQLSVASIVGIGNTDLQRHCLQNRHAGDEIMVKRGRDLQSL